MTLPNWKILGNKERILKKICEGLLTRVGQWKKKMISRTFKTPVSSFWEYIILQQKKSRKEKYKQSVVIFF